MNKRKLPIVSVIVPVYNVEDCLSRCLDSILNQSNQNFELLLIDDGSTDSSGKICDEYAKKDDRIRVFHKENNGVSSARNVGLDKARGTWVAFVDSDDEISKEYLSINDDSKNADIIQKSYIIVEDDSNKEYSVNIENAIIGNKKDLYKFFTEKRNNALWDKLIRRSKIKSTRFLNTVHIGEDFLFFLSIIDRINIYVLNQEIGYVYHVRNQSVMHSVCVNYRYKVLFENIVHIRDVASRQNLVSLGECIIAQTYLALLYRNRRALSLEQKQQMLELYYDISWNNLKYLSMKSKLKFILRKIALILEKIICPK